MGGDNVTAQFNDQMQLDKQLRESFEVYKEFTKIFLDAFALISADGRILKFNQMFCAIAGCRAMDLKSPKPLEKFIILSDESGNQGAIRLLLESRLPLRQDGVHALRKSDSASKQLMISSFPFFGNSGEYLGACVLFRDVTAESNLQGKYTEKSLESVTDALTGLYTRRYFTEFLSMEIEKAKRSRSSPALGVLLFDLDKFKNVNDTYGHLAGDFVIRETALVLRKVARHTDVLSRYGGEELLALLLQNTQEGVCVAAEKFRLAIECHKFVFEGVHIPVTTSVGVTLISDMYEMPDAAIKRADECLYKAKRGGRNACFADFGAGAQRVPLEVLSDEERLACIAS